MTAYPPKNMRMEMGLWGGEHRSPLAHYRPPLGAPVHYKVQRLASPWGGGNHHVFFGDHGTTILLFLEKLIYAIRRSGESVWVDCVTVRSVYNTVSKVLEHRTCLIPRGYAVLESVPPPPTKVGLNLFACGPSVLVLVRI